MVNGCLNTQHSVCKTVACSTRVKDDFGVYSHHVTGKPTTRPIIHINIIQNCHSCVTGWMCPCNTQVFSGCSQCLKPKNGQDDVHAGFAQVLSELNKADAPYALSLANRLYGEQSFQFVEVCVCMSLLCSAWIQWRPGLKLKHVIVQAYSQLP